MNGERNPPESHPESDFTELRDRVGRIETDLAANTASTQRVEELLGQLSELLHFATTGISFFAAIGRSLRAIGRGLRRFVIWISPFLALIGMVWALAHGKWPDKP